MPSKDVPLVDYPNLQAQRCTWWCCKDLPISSLQWRSISSFFSFKYLSWNPSWGFADLLFCFFPCRESGTSEGVCVELRGTSIWWLWVDGCYENFPQSLHRKKTAILIHLDHLKWEMVIDMFQLQVVLVLQERMHSLSCLHNDPYLDEFFLQHNTLHNHFGKTKWVACI
jgi:hypothetical protein